MRRLVKYFVISVAVVLVGMQELSAQYDKDAFFMRGRRALADGKYAQAIENFNVLAQLDTADYWNYFFRGIAKYNLGDLRGAKRDFDRSVRINPVFTSGATMSLREEFMVRISNTPVLPLYPLSKH